MKQTAVEWLVEQEIQLTLDFLAKKISDLEYGFCRLKLIEQAKEMEKEQRGYSKEDVINIVEKSRATGLTAEYLLIIFKSE